MLPGGFSKQSKTAVPIASVLRRWRSFVLLPFGLSVSEQWRIQNLIWVVGGSFCPLCPPSNWLLYSKDWGVAAMITPADISFIMVMERKESVYPQAPLVGDKWQPEASLRVRSMELASAGWGVRSWWVKTSALLQHREMVCKVPLSRNGKKKDQKIKNIFGCHSPH